MASTSTATPAYASLWTNIWALAQAPPGTNTHTLTRGPLGTHALAPALAPAHQLTIKYRPGRI